MAEEKKVSGAVFPFVLQEGSKVTLHVYDLSQGVARQFSMAFKSPPIEGIWITGVVVYGKEFFYDDNCIQDTRVGKSPFGVPVRVEDLGFTSVRKEEFESYLSSISYRYTPNTFHLLDHNCNTFAVEITQFLGCGHVPDYILNHSDEVISNPSSHYLLPKIYTWAADLKAGRSPLYIPPPPPGPPPVPLPVGSGISSSRVRKSAIASEEKQTKSTKQVRFEEPPPAKRPKIPTAAAAAAAHTEMTLEEAKKKIAEELRTEFDAVMEASGGTMRAGEAAVIAMKKIIRKYGHHPKP